MHIFIQEWMYLMHLVLHVFTFSSQGANYYVFIFLYYFCYFTLCELYWMAFEGTGSEKFRNSI